MANIKQLKLPDNTTYDLKDNSGTLSSHLHHIEDLVPLESKTYTNVVATANNFAGGWFFYGKLLPTDFYTIYKIHYRITSIAAGRNDAKTVCDVWICGTQSSLLAYASFNRIANTSYLAQHHNELYRATSAGITGEYGHLIGVRLQSAWNPTTAANSRTITIDILEVENCTFTFFENMTLYADVPGTGSTNYSAYTELNGTSNGLQETGDSDSFDNIMAYFNLKTGAQGIWNASLIMQDGNGCYQNICTASNGTATNANRTTANTKLANPNGFRVGGTIYYSGGNYNANTNITSWGHIRSMQGNIFDARYSFNVTLTANSLTPYTPIYLVGTINSTDGLFYLDQTWWTQTPTATDKVYVLVGGCYDSTTSNCRISLLEHNPWYKYDGTRLVDITTIDTTYPCYSGSAGGTDVTLVTTGDKYNWDNTKPSTIKVGTTPYTTTNGVVELPAYPTVPTVNNATLTINQNNTNKGTFTANQATDQTINLTDTTYESLPEASGGNDVSLVKTGDKWKWNRTFPFKPGLEVASLDDLVGLMDYSFDKRCFSGVIKITTNIGIGVTGWRRIIAIAQNAVNNGLYDIGMFCMFFPANTSDFVNYALIDGKSTGNYLVSKTGQFVTNVFASTVQITTAGNGQLNLGNNLASGATGKSRGRLVIFSNTDTHYSDIRATGLSDDRNLFCPNKSGTIAVTSDITDKKVEQVASTSGTDYYPVVLSSDTSNSNYTGSVVKSTTLSYSSSYGMLRSIVSGNTQWEVGSTEVYFGANQGGISNGNQKLTLYASNESNYQVCLGVVESAWAFHPTTSKKLRLGSPNRLWTTIYAQTGSINTSDRNEKKDIVPLDKTAKDFIMALNPVSYKFKDGESGRTHYGMIAQDVEEEMEELGMTPMDFAGFCKDQKTVPFKREVDGKIIDDAMPVEGEYSYGLRYEEFIPAVIKTVQLQQEEINGLRTELDELKNELAQIKAMLNGGN